MTDDAMLLTREQIEGWRDHLSRLYAGEFSNMAQIETLCNMALAYVAAHQTSAEQELCRGVWAVVHFVEKNPTIVTLDGWDELSYFVRDNSARCAITTEQSAAPDLVGGFLDHVQQHGLMSEVEIAGSFNRDAAFRCKKCGCLWRQHPDRTWSLYNSRQKAGKCCDNSIDFLSLIEQVPAPSAAPDKGAIDDRACCRRCGAFYPVLLSRCPSCGSVFRMPTEGASDE